VRFYISTAGGQGTRPIVFLTGDHFWPVNPKTWQWVPSTAKKFRDAFDETAKDVDTGDLVKIADAFSKMAKTTAIYLGRIGIDGSSGNHVLRKTLIELDTMSAALDALKQRYGFEGFHLAGQSGGSRLVAGLAGMRGDIGCAVSGSGAVAPKGNTNATEPGRSYFDPAIPIMLKNQSLRFIMITDRADEIVPATQQIGFAEKIRRAGGHVPQFFVSATDDHHHGVLAYTQLAAAGCILGKSDVEIATAVGTINKRNTEFVEQRRKEAAALTRKGIGSRQDAEHHSAPAAGHAGTLGKPI
jgi:pimeloyl-ACP methyl ester carboxylesterase